MTRFASLSLALLVTAFATATLAQSNPPRPEVQMRAPATDAQPLPGFHVSTLSPAAETPRPAATRMQPRPAPLAATDGMRLMPKLGLRTGPIQLFIQSIKYQLESYGNTFGAEVNSTNVSDAIFYGANGYVEVDFNVLPGKQYLLDCSLGEDGTYKVGTTFTIGNGGPNFQDGTLSSFNRHLLIPMNPAPNGAQGARVVINFTEIEFYGCQIDNVTQ
jgi:hypothetical protein